MIADLPSLKAYLCKDPKASDTDLTNAVFDSSAQGAQLEIIPNGIRIGDCNLTYSFPKSALMDILKSTHTPFKTLIFKALEREVYSVQIDEDAYLIPLLTSVYEAGTSDPNKVASRLLINAGCGFWALVDSLDADEWHVVEDADDISPKWRTFIEQTTLNGNKL